MRSARVAILLASVLVTSLGCDAINGAIRAFKDARDPLVGTWRQVGDDGGGSITFNRDRTYSMSFGQLDPTLGKDFTTAMQVIASVPGHYSRGDKVIVLSMDMKALKAAVEVAKLPKRGDGTSKGDVADTVCDYKLDGDVLEMTVNGKVSKYVRVK